MGMYTEVLARAEITKEAYDILVQTEFGNRPAEVTHPFWDTPRWNMVLRGESAHFPAGGHLKLIEASSVSGTEYYFSLRSSLKNYDNEIELFFDWLNPHSITGGFLGYSLYEREDTPTLFHKGYQFRPQSSEPADMGWVRAGGYYD